MLSLMITQEIRQNLNFKQKQELKNLLSLEQTLLDPVIPEAVKGFEGMKIADNILRDRDSKGILIGGVSEAIWNQRRKPEELYSHKDIDVLVADKKFYLDKDFEGGIDWWVYKESKINVKSNLGIIENIQKEWYQNGNNLILSFGLYKDLNEDMEPGLYLPGPEWVVKMKSNEVGAHIDYGINVNLDSDVLEAFERKIEKRIGKRLPKFILESFNGHILDYRYEKNTEKLKSFELKKFDLEEIRAINSHIGNFEN